MRHLTFACALALLCAIPAGAQAPAQTTPAGPRAFISLNGGFQATTNDFDDSVTFTENAEDGRFTTDYTVDGGPALNIAGGVTVWKQLGVGVGVTRFSRATPTALSGAVPHPFFFGRSRDVSGDVAGLKREELGVHIRASGVFPAGDRVQVTLFGGPSFFQVKQGLVTDFNYSEEYPYDTATFAGADVVNAEESKLGFNAGADVGFFFTDRLGVGFLIQFAGASVDLPSSSGATRAVKVGGLQAGGGLRLRF